MRRGPADNPASARGTLSYLAAIVGGFLLAICFVSCGGGGGADAPITPITVVDGGGATPPEETPLPPLPTAKPELTEKADHLTPRERPGDYAQAVMDLGATIFPPKNPACGLCPWRGP